MKSIGWTSKTRSGFSLAEVIVATTIGAMVLVAILGVYRAAEGSASAVERNLSRGQLAREILQRIAEDLDKITATSGAEVAVNNKTINGYPAARLVIRKTIKAANKEKELETIVWQSSYDYQSLADGLVLYRKHGGMTVEDKLLDEQRADWEKAFPFVPVCTGVTMFTIKVPVGPDKFVDRWQGSSLPPGVVVTISFGQPYEAEDGTLEIAEEDKFTRTIAINRTRNVKFVFVPDQDLGQPYQDITGENDRNRPGFDLEKAGAEKIDKPAEEKSSEELVDRLKELLKQKPPGR